MTNPIMDWQQVVLNGGPPCFAVDGNRYCGRAKRWQGHGPDHSYVSLDDLLSALKEELSAARGEINAMRDCFECHICQVHNP